MAETLVDFSELPDVTWVRVMSYLHLNERYKVALTCHKLYEAFCHPSLWHTDRIIFLGPDHNIFSRGQRLNIASTSHIGKMRRFGKYYQNLTIEIRGHLIRFADDSREVLNMAAAHCRLDSLTLEIGKLTSWFHLEGVAPKELDLEALISFVKNAFRMRKLAIVSWPMFGEDECDILDAITSNPKLSGLEALTLFLPEVTETSWTERAPILPSPGQTLAAVRHFKHLTHLGLRSPMVTTELLELFCAPERAKMKLLEIAVHYLDRHDFQNLLVPTISSLTWRDVRKACPDLRVECTVVLRVPHFELAKLLTPEVPLSALRYMKYAKVDLQTLTALPEHFHGSLEKLHVLCDMEQADDVLSRLVTRCRHMTELVYCGNIGTAAVVELARVQGDKWKAFQIVGRNIQMPDEFEDVPDDQVLTPGQDGSLVLVGLMRFHQPEEAREARMTDVTEQVSHALGYSWSPR